MAARTRSGVSRFAASADPKSAVRSHECHRRGRSFGDVRAQGAFAREREDIPARRRRVTTVTAQAASYVGPQTWSMFAAAIRCEQIYEGQEQRRSG